MRQLVQNLKNGKTSIINVPIPAISQNEILVEVTTSLISQGTEKMLVDFAKSNMINKARKQPEKVKQVLDKIRTDGVIDTVNTVLNKLDSEIPLGYSSVGIVKAVGREIKEFRIGDRVVCNGPHAEYVVAKKNLCAKIPNKVTDQEAVFTVVGSIGLQGIRLLNCSFGETVYVFGLGLIGLISIQILKQSGCRVIGVDIDDDKINLAKDFGVEAINSNNIDVLAHAKNLTNGKGVDGVLITASSPNNEILTLSAQISRMRGKIVLVGVIDIQIDRSLFYEKELTFQVSSSYGPGRYDNIYESGNDYPFGFVRWTAGRNFEAILAGLDSNLIHVKSIISDLVDFENVLSIYDTINTQKRIGTIICYEDSKSFESPKFVSLNDGSKRTFNQNNSQLGVAIIGAGNYTRMTLLPSLKDMDINLNWIVSKTGLTGTELAKKFSIDKSSTDIDLVLNDKATDIVIITTRHNSHHDLVKKALEAGKNVFVEKPLCLSLEQLEDISRAYFSSNQKLFVGYNRRYSPFSIKLKKFLSGNPISVVANFNAGFIPPDSWVHDMKIGGGRIIGEACHFIDLICYFTDSLVQSVCTNALGKDPTKNSDNASIFLKFENGSIGVINYFSNGSKKYQKERIEVFDSGKVFIIDNFKSLTMFGENGFRKKSFRVNKGHRNQFVEILDNLRNECPPLVSFEELSNISMATFAAIESLEKNRWINLKEL